MKETSVKSLDDDLDIETILTCYHKRRAIADNLWIIDGAVSTSIDHTLYHRAVYLKLHNGNFYGSCKLQSLLDVS